ncbi:MAG: hypothetical protein CMC18_03550 [Flavobacteriaceae bacterium]|nr:hypothetical protein [Flavobacteriaceae bacterium]
MRKILLYSATFLMLNSCSLLGAVDFVWPKITSSQLKTIYGGRAEQEIQQQLTIEFGKDVLPSTHFYVKIRKDWLELKALDQTRTTFFVNFDKLEDVKRTNTSGRNGSSSAVLVRSFNLKIEGAYTKKTQRIQAQINSKPILRQ